MIYTIDELRFVKKPSQWVNIGWLLFGIAAFLLVIPPILFLWNYLIVYCWKYEFRDMTIAQKTGVFSTLKDEIHYYRIKSIRIEQPFLMRFVGLSNIILETSEPLHNNLRLYAIKDGEEVREFLKEKVFYWRRINGVAEYDFHKIS